MAFSLNQAILSVLKSPTLPPHSLSPPFTLLCSYLLRLKEDPTLCQTMGTAGRACVMDKGVERVVKDLLDWYEQGQRNRRQRGVLGVITRLSILLFTIPFAIVSIAGYELVVSTVSSSSSSSHCHTGRFGC